MKKLLMTFGSPTFIQKRLKNNAADLDNDGELSSYEECVIKKLGGLGGLFGSVINSVRTSSNEKKLGMPELETDEYGQLKPFQNK